MRNSNRLESYHFPVEQMWNKFPLIPRYIPDFALTIRFFRSQKILSAPSYTSFTGINAISTYPAQHLPRIPAAAGSLPLSGFISAPFFVLEYIYLEQLEGKTSLNLAF